MKDPPSLLPRTLPKVKVILKQTLCSLQDYSTGVGVGANIFVPYFQDQGYKCIAMDLSGRGKHLTKQQMNKFTIKNWEKAAEGINEWLTSEGF